MNLAKIVFLTGFIFVLTCCSVQRSLNQEYKGKTQDEVMLSMGRPTRVENLDGGRKINIYEKSKFLKAAAINTGQFQYDKFESPKAIKVELIKFYLNSSGVVEEVKYEVNYEH